MKCCCDCKNRHKLCHLLCLEYQKERFVNIMMAKLSKRSREAEYLERDRVLANRAKWQAKIRRGRK